MSYNFKQASFATTVNDLLKLPTVTKEIAIVGRSNAGKSSLLNTLTNQTRLAFTSKTPGRTQHINYFLIGNGLYLVDLPGYGYAKVPQEIREHWVGLLGDYLRYREPLCGLVLIMDARHPLKELDIQMIEFFAVTAKPIHIVLSKADKLTKQQQVIVLRQVANSLAKYAINNLSVQLFSSLKRMGVEDLEWQLNQWLTDAAAF